VGDHTGGSTSQRHRVPLSLRAPPHSDQEGGAFGGGAWRRRAGTLKSRTHIDVSPVEGYASLVHLTPPAPPQPVHGDDPSPDRLLNAGRKKPECDIHAGRWTGSVGRELIGGGRPSGLPEASLFGGSSKAGDDRYGAPSLLNVIASRTLKTTSDILRNAPPS